MWVFGSVLAGLLFAGYGLLSKVALKRYSVSFVTFITFALVTLVLLPFALASNCMWPPSQFWAYLLAGVATNCLANYFLVSGMKLSDLSIVGPIQLLGPLFVAVLSPLVAGQKLAPLGLLGVVVIVVGTYLLNAEANWRRDLFAPIKGLFRDRGVQLTMLGVVMMALTAVIDVPGSQMSTVTTWMCAKFAVSTLVVAPFALRSKCRPALPGSPFLIKVLIFAGLVLGTGSLVHSLILNMAYAVYVVAIERMGVLGMIFGSYYLLGEEKSCGRVAGVVVMLMGTTILSFAT